MTKKLISVIAVLFTMFSLSAATVKLYNKGSMEPCFSDKISIKDAESYQIYDTFAKSCALSPDDVEIVFNKDENNSSLTFKSTCYGMTATLYFDAYDADDYDAFYNLILKYAEAK